MQEDFKKEYAKSITDCQAEGDPYRDNFASLTNLLLQLNSIRVVTSMWRASRRNYDAVIYMRPDLLVNCRLPVEHIQDMKPDTWYLADFHHWQGFNDRFLMAGPMAAAMWGDRLNFAFATCRQHRVRRHVCSACCCYKNR